MPVTNNVLKGIDLPFFELVNQAPTATAATAGMTTAEDGSQRYIYYLTTGNVFYRYDTQYDTWHQLANFIGTVTTGVSMRYTKRRGTHGKVISATSTSVTIGGLRGPTLDGYTMSIEYGTGAGQERALTYASEAIYDAGVITGTTTSTLVDATKKWKVNQWAGYTVGITFGTDVTEYRRILYNDTTTLYIADTNLQSHEPWNNQIFLAAAPYAVPVTTGGSQAHYQISAQVFNVSSWTTTPDATSYANVQAGGLYVVTSSASAPFFLAYYYDVAADRWQQKTVPQSLIAAALGTDFTIERTAKLGGNLAFGNAATSLSTTAKLVDNAKNLGFDRYANHRLAITSGTGSGQNRRIHAHNANSFFVQPPFDTAPDNTSLYEIWPDWDMIYMTGGAAASLYAYSPEKDFWMQGNWFDFGIANVLSARMLGWQPIAVTSATRVAAGVTSIASAPTAGGSGYVLGDILTCSVGGTGAQVIVTGIAASGVVTALELVHSGTLTGFTVSSGNATTGGTGTGCTINITGVGVTAVVTTATNHWFKTGDTITFNGATEAAWNTSYTILGVPGITSFCVTGSFTANPAAQFALGTTTLAIVDSVKNWTVNEHVGRLLHICVAGATPTSQVRWITGNGANVVNVGLAITAAGAGTSRYMIYDAKVFGVDEQSRANNRRNFGFATSGNTTTLIDTTKDWVPEQWKGYNVKIESGTGYGTRIAIANNSNNTLNTAGWGFTPDTTTKYEIADAWGLNTAATLNTITDTSKNWVVNFWAGKRVRVTAGTLFGTTTAEVASTASAATTVTAAIGTPATDSAYAILSTPARGAGIELQFLFGLSDTTRKGRYIVSPRGGGSNTFDIYDIPTGKFIFGYFVSPQNEGFTTGSSYAYDGVDTLFFARSTTGTVIRILGYDVNKNRFSNAAFTSTVVQGTAHIGNFLEIVQTSDGAKYIYSLINTGTIMSRALMF